MQLLKARDRFSGGVISKLKQMLKRADNTPVYFEMASGIENYDTLLYSPEIKMYSAKPVFLNDKFEIVEDVFCFGDCSSVTRSLSQAGAMGVYVADRVSL